MQVTARLSGAAALDSRHPHKHGDTDTHPLRTAFSQALIGLGPFGPAPHLAVALSGGADSMACTLLAHHWATAHGGRITAFTVDHGLRPESAAEAAQVAAWMQAHGIAHHILTPPHGTHATNLQESARERRYDALADACRAQDILHCLLAHHAGDQRETVAHNLARGDTADGASGMSAVRNYRGVRFLRPLLGCERPALEAFLTTNAVQWVEDPSNHNEAFARVRTRQRLAADAAERAALTARADAEAAGRIAREQQLAATAARLVTLHPEGRAELPLAAWQALAPEHGAALLANLLTTIGNRSNRPRRADTLRLCAALHKPFTRRTLHGCLIAVTHGTLTIAPEAAQPMPLLTPLKPLAAAPFWWLKTN